MGELIVAGRGWIVAGSITAALGVGIGAFGAHGLEDALKSLPGETVDVAAKSATFETAVRYQMYHALGMILAGLIAGRGRNVPASIAGWFVLVGVAVFSGLLYALVFGGPSILGAIVPNRRRGDDRRLDCPGRGRLERRFGVRRSGRCRSRVQTATAAGWTAHRRLETAPTEFDVCPS